MSERKEVNRMDWIGLGLFAVGSTGAVLMCLAMGTAGPLEERGPFVGPAAALWKNALGIFPAMFLNVAIAFLGARLFLQGGAATIVRNLLGCTGLALALSIICGAWSPIAGGSVGAHTGQVTAHLTGVAVGTLVGLVAFFAVAWFGWLRAPNVDAISEDRVETQVLESSTKPITRSATRPAVHKTTAVNEGVTPAESAALFPDELDEPVVVKKLGPEEVARAPIPPSPYPEDVRRKGQIPAGAKVLEAPNAAIDAPPAPANPNVYRWTAPITEREEVEVAPADVAREDVVEEIEAPAANEIRFEVNRPAARNLDVDEDVAANVERAPMALPSPSWEQPPLFRPEAGDEEPVDAYGTPLTLVEQLRRARKESGLEGTPAAVPIVEDDLVEVDEEELEPISARADLDDMDELEEDLLDGEDENEGDGADALEGEIAAFEDEPVEEIVAVSTSIPRELDALDDEPEMLAVTAEDVDDVEASDEVDEAVDAEFEETELEEVELVAQEPTPALEPLVLPAIVTERPAAPEVERKAAPQRAERLQTSLFDAVEANPAAAEREVVLQPAAAPADRASKAPAAAADAHTQQLSEIGCLFIERGRVAVSMLQRQYQMDFDDACKVLDDLQEMGLIGPYLGGQRRDILLTREQWLERVSQSSVAR